MFQFGRFPRRSYGFTAASHDMTRAGFPHSDISGSKRICRSPKLIAACRVLHRLPMPRHSPCALLRLNFLSVCSRKLRSLHESRKSVFFANCNTITCVGKTMFIHDSSVFSICLLSIFSFQGTSARISPRLVGSNGFEPSTSRLSGARSNQLSYEPIFGSVLSILPSLDLPPMVEMKGFEPSTPCLQGRCSPI